MSYCKSINILNIISNYYLVCRVSSAPVAVSGCYLLSPSSTVPVTPICIISYTYVWYILYYITYHHISYVFNYNMCYMLPCLSHLICSCCSIRLLSVVLFLLLMSALYTLYHTYMCYSYIHIFNYNMCYSYISYHNVTLCALHPHPYYTIHHHQTFTTIDIKVVKVINLITLTDKILWPTKNDELKNDVRFRKMKLDRKNNFFWTILWKNKKIRPFSEAIYYLSALLV